MPKPLLDFDAVLLQGIKIAAIQNDVKSILG